MRRRRKCESTKWILRNLAMSRPNRSRESLRRKMMRRRLDSRRPLFMTRLLTIGLRLTPARRRRRSLQINSLAR
jgi:hypothetical protein